MENIIPVLMCESKEKIENSCNLCVYNALATRVDITIGYYGHERLREELLPIHARPGKLHSHFHTSYFHNLHMGGQYLQCSANCWNPASVHQ